MNLKVIASSLVLLAIALSACHHGADTMSGRESFPLEREKMPVLNTTTVSTLISDSGIIRYRIETEEWLIFDKTEPSCQEFPKGIYLEQFDLDLNVEASLKADYAYYDDVAQIWSLKGNVHALNRKGEQFDTPKLIWDQKSHRVYSDTTIHITRETSIIEGVGFESNEEMSKYTIMHPTGVFPIDDEEEAQPAEEQTEEQKLKVENI